MLLEWLSDAEMKLRFAGPLPEDEATTRQQIAEHQQFMREMDEQQVNKVGTPGSIHLQPSLARRARGCGNAASSQTAPPFPA